MTINSTHTHTHHNLPALIKYEKLSTSFIFARIVVYCTFDRFQVARVNRLKRGSISNSHPKIKIMFFRFPPPQSAKATQWLDTIE